jgi:protein SCO1/2
MKHTLLIPGLVWLALGGLGCRQAEPATPPPPAPAAAPQEPQGDQFLGKLEVPDVVLMDQHGTPVHLRQELIGDKVVVMNFIFTSCKTICPPLGLSFSRLQRDLGERAGREVNLVSISLDPVNDTPERLKAWGERYQAGPGWRLLTGSRQEVDAVLKALTVYTPAKEEHTPVIIIGDGSSGEWTRSFGLGSPTHIVATVDRMLEARAARRTEAP